ncbi:MAG: CRISPR-associated endonuclease Cas2 [Mycobacteriaceae bacterium]
MALTVLAFYDIVDNGRRSKVAAKLQRWGNRLQYSVFLCTIGVKDLALLTREVESIIDAETDSFFVARQCASCWELKGLSGQASPGEPVLFWAVF